VACSKTCSMVSSRLARPAKDVSPSRLRSPEPTYSESARPTIARNGFAVATGTSSAPGGRGRGRARASSSATGRSMGGRRESRHSTSGFTAEKSSFWCTRRATDRRRRKGCFLGFPPGGSSVSLGEPSAEETAAGARTRAGTGAGAGVGARASLPLRRSAASLSSLWRRKARWLLQRRYSLAMVVAARSLSSSSLCAAPCAPSNSPGRACSPAGAEAAARWDARLR